MIFKETPRPIPKPELLRIENESENVIDLSLELEEIVDEPIDLSNSMIEMSTDNYELYSDDEVVITMEDTADAEYYMEYRRAGDPVNKLRKGKFHSKFINIFVNTLKQYGISPVFILRNDGKVVLDERVPSSLSTPARKLTQSV